MQVLAGMSFVMSENSKIFSSVMIFKNYRIVSLEYLLGSENKSLFTYARMNEIVKITSEVGSAHQSAFCGIKDQELTLFI